MSKFLRNDEPRIGAFLSFSRSLVLRIAGCWKQMTILFVALFAVIQAHAQVNSAEFVSQSVSATMYSGEKYTVSVTMRNSGTSTWTAANQYRLGSQNPMDNQTWGLGRVDVAASVAPGQTYTFTFTVTAPQKIGTYNFQWKMLREGVEWFGAVGANAVVNVTLPPPVNGSSFVSQSVPSTMTAGRQYTVSVRMKNTGNTAWGGEYRLGSQNPMDNNIWGIGRAPIQTGIPVPGQEYTFSFTVTAPTTPGTYNFQWRMVQEYVEWFGATTPNVVITVQGAAAAPTVSVQRTPSTLIAGSGYTLSWSTTNATSLSYVCTASGTGYTVNKTMAVSGSVTETALAAWVGYPSTCTWTATGAGGTKTYTETVTTSNSSANAGFVSQSVASSMTGGQQYPVSITMSNTGTTTWPANSTFALASQNPAGNTTWLPAGKVVLPASVAPGQQYTFSFNVTAPASAGTYGFQWQMQNGSTYFGNASTNVTVAVSGATTTTPSVTAPSKTLTRVRAFEYGAATGMLDKEIIEPDNTQLRVESAYLYDTWGNQKSRTVSSPATGTAAIVARTENVTYDTRGQFPASVTNALDQASSQTYDQRFGSLASVTTPNAQNSTVLYDSFGRRSLVTYADGTKTRYTYAYCQSAGGATACSGYAKYLVTAQPLASDGATANGPWTKAYFDSENHEVRTETLGFDGSSVIIVEKEYDERGRLKRSSLPRYASQTVQWTSYSYDDLGRLTQSVNAENATTTYDYSGLTRTVTNALNRVTTYQQNILGQLVKTTDDAAKSLTYSYDAFGNLWQTLDPLGNKVSSEFDLLGRKRRSVDADMGDWSYEYDALGQLVKQTSARKHVTSFIYDKLGRVTSRSEPDLKSTWVYDNCTKGVGLLCSATTDNGYAISKTYDAVSRPSTSTTTVDAAYAATATYNSTNGRIATLTYPEGLVIKYVYTSLGYLQEIRDNATNALYWRADSMDAMGHYTQQTYGNGVVTQQVYYPATGALKNVYAGAGNSVQNLTFEFDKIGNLVARSDANQSLSETNLYDGLNRLKQSTINSSGAGLVSQTYTYDDIGNIKTRSGVGTYTYGAVNSKPHAVASIALAAGGSRSYSYDDNGNLTTETEKNASGTAVGTRTISYTSFDMPLTVTKSSATVSYLYGADHQRVKQTGSAGTIVYVHPDQAGGTFYEKETRPDGTVEHRQYISVGGAAVAIVKKKWERLSPPNICTAIISTLPQWSLPKREQWWSVYRMNRSASAASLPGRSIQATRSLV